ncbi:MAG TPA: glycosyltransferase [Kofleriaceae bacterium]
MRVLLVVFSDAGHLNAMLAVAQHLEHRGHELTVFSVQTDVSARCARAGLSARCVAAIHTSGIAPDRSQRSIKLAEQLGNARWLRRWLTLSLVDAVPNVLEALDAAIRDCTPDVIATDAMAYAGAVAASRAGVPWASIATSALGFLPADDPTSQVFRDIDPGRRLMVKALGATLSFRGSDVISPHLDIAFLATELFPVDGVQLLGAALPRTSLATDHPFPWDRLPHDRPLVLVCFGSHLSPRPEIYAKICGALTDDEAFFVVVLKDLLEEPFAAELPAHALAVEYAPQLPLLERCAAMIHHGGANSVMECISCGVPMMILPLGYDQHALGAAAARAGLGVVVDPANASEADLRRSLLQILAPEGPRLETQRLAGSNRHGAERAAELIEHLGSR